MLPRIPAEWLSSRSTGVRADGLRSSDGAWGEAVTELPADATRYHRTDVYTHETIPRSFLDSSHTTKAGVWCRVSVVEGSLTYRSLLSPAFEVTLTTGRPGIVEPEVEHAFELCGPVRFYVEFFRCSD
jgi:tellurite resistance-related uncharacterized protein